MLDRHARSVQDILKLRYIEPEEGHSKGEEHSGKQTSGANSEEVEPLPGICYRIVGREGFGEMGLVEWLDFGQGRTDFGAGMEWDRTTYMTTRLTK